MLTPATKSTKDSNHVPFPFAEATRPPAAHVLRFAADMEQQQAEAHFKRAAELRHLANEADGMTGDAEAALWRLATAAV